MIYLMHPQGAVHPVRVEPEESLLVLAEALEALGLIGEDAIDELWLAGEEVAVTADGSRLASVAARYRGLTKTQIDAALAGAGCPRSAVDVLVGFVAFLDDVAGRCLVIERLR